jgi:hypothetical protein
MVRVSRLPMASLLRRKVVSLSVFSRLVLGSFTHWFMAALISWTFPVFAEISGGFIFTFYAFCMVLQLLWVIFKMPETKGIPLEELQKKLHL